VSALERWSLHVAALLTAGTGILYGWLRYFGQRAGEFGPEAHPLQALLQHLHVLAAPALVLALGVILKGHVGPQLRNGRLSLLRTGLWLLAGLAPMILGGYAVQVVADPGWRKLWAWVHGLASLLFLGAYLLHLARKREPLGAPEAPPDPA
jgi:hypothetical protein